MSGLGILMAEESGAWREEDFPTLRPRVGISAPGTENWVEEELFTARLKIAMSSSLSTAPGSVSPQSSPRLPSPPPYPEVQLAPPSPGADKSVEGGLKDVGEGALLDNGASRRIRPGTKAADMASGPPLVPLTEVPSPQRLSIVPMPQC